MRDEKVLATKVELRNRPRRSNSKQSVERNGKGGGDQCQTDGGRACIGFTNRFPIAGPSFIECLNEDGHQRRYQKEREKQRAQIGDEHPSNDCFPKLLSASRCRRVVTTVS